mmetsp:Transcript_6034/g.6793  ORF Transcript_6034/g.6793 Transcript_6034/m.6793 type:complete len:421 (+) Transcript_6034:940-2202(+)
MLVGSHSGSSFDIPKKESEFIKAKSCTSNSEGCLSYHESIPSRQEIKISDMPFESSDSSGSDVPISKRSSCSDVPISIRSKIASFMTQSLNSSLKEVFVKKSEKSSSASNKSKKSGSSLASHKSRKSGSSSLKNSQATGSVKSNKSLKKGSFKQLSESGASQSSQSSASPKIKEEKTYKKVDGYSESNSSEEEKKVDVEKSLPLEDPIIAEEGLEQVEYPEMVKRSVMMEYKPFDNTYIKSLQVKWIRPEDMVHIVQKDTETFNIEFVAMNPDALNSTRWPIYSTIILRNLDKNELIKCTATNKETRAGVKAKFTAKIKTPKNKNYALYEFQMVDEFGRSFGVPIIVKIKVDESSIIDLSEDVADPDPSAFEEELHEAEKKHPNAIITLKEMGIPMDEKALDALLKANGKVEEFMESFKF